MELHDEVSHLAICVPTARDEFSSWAKLSEEQMDSYQWLCYRTSFQFPPVFLSMWIYCAADMALETISSMTPAKIQPPSRRTWLRQRLRTQSLLPFQQI